MEELKGKMMEARRGAMDAMAGFMQAVRSGDEKSKGEAIEKVKTETKKLNAENKKARQLLKIMKQSLAKHK